MPSTNQAQPAQGEGLRFIDSTTSEAVTRRWLAPRTRSAVASTLATIALAGGIFSGCASKQEPEPRGSAPATQPRIDTGGKSDTRADGNEKIQTTKPASGESGSLGKMTPVAEPATERAPDRAVTDSVLMPGGRDVDQKDKAKLGAPGAPGPVGGPAVDPKSSGVSSAAVPPTATPSMPASRGTEGLEGALDPRSPGAGLLTQYLLPESSGNAFDVRSTNMQAVNQSDEGSPALRNILTPGAEEDAKRRAAMQAAGAVVPMPVTIESVAGMLPAAHEELWIIESALEKLDTPAVGALGASATKREQAREGCGRLIDATSSAGELTQVSTSFSARVDMNMSLVTYDQRFRNDRAEHVREAVYSLPLPGDGTPHDFVMTIGKRTIRGVIRPREEARRIYGIAVDRGLKASLVAPKDNIFAARLSNIAPGSTVGVTLTYFHVLPLESGEFVLKVPLKGVKGEVSGTVAWNACMPIEGVRSVTHAIEAVVPEGEKHLPRSRGTVKLLGALSAGGDVGASDFELRVLVTSGSDVRPGLATFTDEMGDTYFAAIKVPPVATAQVPPRRQIEWCVVVDGGAGMNAEQRDLAQKTAAALLKRMQPGDFARVWTAPGTGVPSGGDSITAWTTATVKAMNDHLASALSKGDGAKQTNLTETVRSAMAIKGTPQLQRIVVVISGGGFDDKAEMLTLAQGDLKFNRLYCVAVKTGKDSGERALMKLIASAGRGALGIVQGEEDIEPMAAEMTGRLARPAEIDISLGFNQTKGSDVYPRRTLDVLIDRPSLVIGRYVRQPASVVSFTGRTGPDVKFTMMNPAVTDLKKGNPVIGLVWARRRIADMTAYATSATLPTLEADLKAHAMQYGLPTPWTALIAVDAAAEPNGK